MAGENAAHRLIVDPSALLCRYLPDSRRSVVDELIDGAGQVVVTALARTEVELGLHHAVGAAASAGPDSPSARFARDWSRFWVLPIDQRCLRRAADLGRSHGLNLTNALHLAAIDPVPRPATLLTMDDRQVAAAADLGFDIVEPQAGGNLAHGLLQPSR